MALLTNVRLGCLGKTFDLLMSVRELHESKCFITLDPGVYVAKLFYYVDDSPSY